MTQSHILPFTAPEGAPAAELDTVGGKGLSLAWLPAAGFAVPAGSKTGGNCAISCGS